MAGMFDFGQVLTGTTTLAQSGLFGSKVKNGADALVTPGGVISPIGQATLQFKIAPNGTPAEPRIVQTGITNSTGGSTGSVAKFLDYAKRNQTTVALAVVGLVVGVVLLRRVL